MIFLLIDNQFDLKITLRILNPENQSSILLKIRKMLLLSKLFTVSISFSVSIDNHPCYPNKEKTNKLFVYCCDIFPVIDPNEHLTQYNNRYVILTTYMIQT